MKSLSVGILLLLPLLLTGQGDDLRLKPSDSLYNLLYCAREDTYTLYELSFLIQEELKKKSYLDLDLITRWSHDAISICESNSLPEALPEIYTHLGQAYMWKTKISEARKHYTIAIDKAKDSENLEAEARAHLGLGYSFIYGNLYQAATSEILHALSLARVVGNKKLQVEIYEQLARIYYISRDLLSSYKTSKLLVELAKQIQDQQAVIKGYSFLGDLYGEMNLHDKQKEIIDSCLTRSLFVRDSATLYTIYNMAYEGSLNMSQYHSALQYAQRMKFLAGELHNDHIVDAKIGKAYLKLNQLEQAKRYYEQSLQANRRLGIYIDTYKYLDLGRIEFGLGNKQAAFHYFKLAEADIDKPLLQTQRDIYKALYEYYDNAGERNIAYAYLEQYNEYADSLQRFQNSIKFGLTVLEYETLLLQNKMELLSKDNAFSSAIALRHKQRKNMAYASSLAILLITGLAFYRYKKYRELSYKAAITNERLRISRDLHDEVGSALSGIAMYSHVANEQVRNKQFPDVFKSLHIMQRSAHEMIAKLSDIVWLINPEQDTIAELFDRLEEYTHQVTSIRSMAVAMHVPERFSDVHLPLEARRSIYLFCKEAIHNSVKYSEGTQIWLEVKEDSAGLRFTVRDNGKGFDELTIKKGNGLRNMKKRAEEIGALVNFRIGKGIGTQIDMYYKIMQ